MQLLNFGRSLYGRVSGRGPQLTHEVVGLAVTAGSGLAAGYLSARSNINGGAGKILGLPIPVAGGLALGALAMAGVGGSANEHILSAMKGMLTAQAAFMGIKMAYSGSGQSPTVAALPRGGRAYLHGGQVYAMGATPQVEALLKEARLAA